MYQVPHPSGYSQFADMLAKCVGESWGDLNRRWK
jgi:hypothetical protein